MVRATAPGLAPNPRLTPVPATQELLIDICEREAGPTPGCSRGCSRVQDTGIPAVRPRSGFATGRQSQGSATAWQRSDQGNTSCSHPVGPACFGERDRTGYVVLCTRKVTLPAWCVPSGAYHLGFINTEGHGLTGAVSQEAKSSLNLLRDGASQHLSGASL